MPSHSFVRLFLILVLGLGFFACATLPAEAQESNAAPALETPRPLLRLEELGRASRNNYGSLEATIQLMRAHRPLDLNAAQWRREHPAASFDVWARQARR